MDREVSRWLAPAGASVAVLAVFVVPGLVAATIDAQNGGGQNGGGRNGGGRDRASVVEPHDPITPDLPPEPIETEGTTADRSVAITGYRAEGRALRVFYTVDQSTDCSSRIEPPVTRERPDAVVVFLERRISRAPNEVCTHLMLANSVDIPLQRPLADRVVQDGSLEYALVPLEPPSGTAMLATPPVGRAGR